jgi:hypothetical protein
MGFCPLQYAGSSGGRYYYYGLGCPRSTPGNGNDNRIHQTGVNCVNIRDPIGACGGAEHVCGNEATGLANYVTLKERFRARKPAVVIGQATAVYQDGRRKRKARLFLVQSKSRGNAPQVMRVGLELAPTTALPAEGRFQATLTHKKGCYHCIRLDGMDGHCFHIVTKGPGKAREKGEAMQRVRASR